MAIWTVLFSVICICFKIDAASVCQFQILSPDGDTESYDFSSLMTNTPWEIPDASDSKGKGGVIFLSMCGTLQGLSPSQCPDSTASVCLARRGDKDKWKTVISNAGSINQTRLWYNNRQLVLSLKGDQVCKNGKNYSTNIHLNCNQQTIGEPWYINLRDECVVEVGWVTSAACPVTPEHDTCFLPVPGGRPLDLTSLTSTTYYTVKEPGGKVFQINLCSDIKEGACGPGVTACIVNSTTTIGKLDVGSELAHIPGGLKLKYYEGGGLSTEIEFTCNILAPIKPEPKFVAINNKTYMFHIETPFACPAAPIDCVVYDNRGTKYDLNALRRNQGLWTVRDNRRGKSNFLYHINVCGPLPSGVTPACLAGNVGACVTNTKPNLPSYSLGLVEQPPKVTKDGTLLLEYRGGSPCKQSKFRRRLSIALECSETEQGPVLDAVHEDCSYAFLWRTPTACASKPSQGGNCRVMDSRLPYSFDVRSLYNNQADHQLQGDNNDSFRVNICGSLHAPCNGLDNVSVCLKRGGKEFAIGHRDDRLMYQDGRLSFTLVGDQCQPGVNSSVTIILGCEHLDPQAPSPTPQVFPSSTNDCQFFMVWNHPKACPPYHEISCSVRDELGQLYDLSGLSWRSANHEARGHDGRRSGFQLNVCRSVVFGRDAACEPTSGACMNVNGKFINVGDVRDGPYIETGMLKLKYDQGALCPIKGAADHITTVITFLCDPDALDSEPEYLGEFKCQHQILWRIADACPRTFETTPASDSCYVINPYTKYRFDLSPLRNQEFVTEDEDGNKYALGVCSPPKNNMCSDGVGSCITIENVNHNSGMANGNLQFRSSGSLFLNYTNGEKCGMDGQNQRGTLIEFMCGAEGSIDGPRVVDVLGDGCLIVIHWHTELVCEKRIRCVSNYLDQEVDLSSLIRVTQNYQAVAPDGREFFINVCRPVISVNGLSCPAGSGACVAKKIDKTYKEELSLGFPSVQPLVTSSQEASLMYIQGSACPNEPGINISSLIKFKCDLNAGPGNPVFISETHDCQYQFEWRTSLVCGELEEKIGKCTVYSEQLKRYISFESLQKSGGYKAKGNQNQASYSLNLCGDPGTCQGAAVCHGSNTDWASHGTLQRALYDYQNDYLKLQYSGGSPCVRNETYGAEVWLHCDAGAGNGNPRIIMEHECFVIFEWRTSAVCVSNKQRTSTVSPVSPVIGPSNKPAPVSESSTGSLSTGGIVAMLLGLAVSIVLGVLIGLYVYRGGRFCGSNNWRLSRWIHSPSHAQVHYSRVASADEASHLLRSQPELEWDSDEELLKV